MVKQSPFVFFFFFFFTLILILLTGLEGSSDPGNSVPTKLFVFGDSYADTGNIGKSLSGSWKLPYGITFPGKPSGRFSDGRVFTDYIAKFVGIRSPLPYKWRKYAGKHLKYGMNFAFGGTGVLDTLVMLPNMTTQIDLFEKLIINNTKVDMRSSMALLSIAGNDYSSYLSKGGSPQGLQAFIGVVINQLATNMKRVHKLGVRKIVVTALQPLGCLPISAALSTFQQCNDTENIAVGFHNLLLQQAVAKFNNETKDSSFVILDLYGSFTSVLKNKGDHLGSLRFESPLKPCCMGKSSEYNCGSTDEKGEKMYTVCDNPEAAFFWDSVHPTQAGWTAVYFALESTLHQIYL